MTPDDAADLAADEAPEPGRRDVAVTLDRDGSGTILIGGEEVRGVSGVTIDAEARPRSADVELRFPVADRVDFLGAARVTVDTDTAAALRLLGWTPPDADRTQTDREQHIADAAIRARDVAQALVDRAVATLLAGDRP